MYLRFFKIKPPCCNFYFTWRTKRFSRYKKKTFQIRNKKRGLNDRLHFAHPNKTRLNPS